MHSDSSIPIESFDQSSSISGPPKQSTYIKIIDETENKEMEEIQECSIKTVRGGRSFEAQFEDHSDIFQNALGSIYMLVFLHSFLYVK